MCVHAQLARTRRSLCGISIATCVAFIGGCGGGATGIGGDSGSGMVGADSRLTISPSTMVVVQGKSAQATLTLTRVGKAAENASVHIIVPVLSKGLAATFDPATLAPGVSTTTVTIAADIDADIASSHPIFIPFVGSDTLGTTGGLPAISLAVKFARPCVVIMKAGWARG